MTNGEVELSLLSTGIRQLQSRFQYGIDKIYENHFNGQEIVHSNPFCFVSLHECKGIGPFILQKNHFGSQ